MTIGTRGARHNVLIGIALTWIRVLAKTKVAARDRGCMRQAHIKLRGLSELASRAKSQVSDALKGSDRLANVMLQKQVYINK